MATEFRVFLADGSIEYLDLMRYILERQEDIHVVGCARRGTEAYQQILTCKPDILVTDILLPSMDGLTLLQRLRAENMLPCTLVVTAFVNDYIARAVCQAGARDFLQKPCDGTLLAERIRSAYSLAVPSITVTDDPAIRVALARFGIPSHLNGFQYLLEAIRRAFVDHSILRGVTKILYPELARMFQTTPGCVEHSIRNALIIGWQSETPANRQDYFGSTFSCFQRAPSNTKFMAAMVNFLEQNGHQSSWA